MVDKQKVVVILLVVAILFSVVSTVLTLQLMNYKAPPVNRPMVVYTGKYVQGSPFGGVGITVIPRSSK